MQPTDPYPEVTQALLDEMPALVGVFPAKDVVVWTPSEVEEWSRVPNTFITAALREGRTLYER